MDTIWTWAKENFDIISLLVGIIGVFLSVYTLMYELRKRKKERLKGKKTEGDRFPHWE